MVEEVEIREHYTVGIFIRDFLQQHSESYSSEIHKAYKESYRGLKTQKKRTYRLCTYNSFMTYVSKLILTGLVKRTGKTEESDNLKAEALDYPERVYIKLTIKGKRAPTFIWQHPLRIYYYPQDWEKAEYGAYVRR